MKTATATSNGNNFHSNAWNPALKIKMKEEVETYRERVLRHRDKVETLYAAGMNFAAKMRRMYPKLVGDLTDRKMQMYFHETYCKQYGRGEGGNLVVTRSGVARPRTPAEAKRDTTNRAAAKRAKVKPKKSVAQVPTVMVRSHSSSEEPSVRLLHSVVDTLAAQGSKEAIRDLLDLAWEHMKLTVR